MKNEKEYKVNGLPYNIRVTSYQANENSTKEKGSATLTETDIKEGSEDYKKIEEFIIDIARNRVEKLGW